MTKHNDRVHMLFMNYRRKVERRFGVTPGVGLTRFREWHEAQPNKDDGQMMVQLGRPSLGYGLDNITLVPAKLGRGNGKPRPVSSINIYTGKITHYDSMTAAGRILGIHKSSIERAVFKNEIFSNCRWYTTEV